jgi:hypothetical protein
MARMVRLANSAMGMRDKSSTKDNRITLLGLEAGIMDMEIVKGVFTTRTLSSHRPLGTEVS